VCMNNFIAIIPARGGSKGIIGKNLKPIGSLPMVVYSITAALTCKSIDAVYVSSDSDEILDIAKLYGAETIKRPDNLARDTTSSEEVLEHAILQTKSKYCILIQPTSPTLETDDLEFGICKYIKEEYTTLFSAVVTNDMLIWDEESMYPMNYDPKNREMRQTRKRKLLIENGAFYIFSRKGFKRTGCRLHGKVGYYEMPYWRSFQVDTVKDLNGIRTLMTTKGII